MFESWHFCYILQALVLLMLTAFNKRKHVVWGTVKSRDAVNSSNIISSPGQVFMIISPCHGNYNVIRRTLINDRLWITFFSMSLLVLHNEIKAIRPYDLSKPLITEPRITSRSLLLHRLPLLKPAVFQIHDPLSSSKNFLVYCTLLLNCPFCEYPEDIIDFGKRHFQWNWGASNSAKVILTVSPCR